MPQGPHILSRTLTVFLWLSAVIATWLLASAIVGSLHYLRPGPGFDYWTGAMPFLQAVIDGPWQWSLLWENYAGAHGLLLSRLLFLLEWYVGDFRGYLLLACSWFAIIASAVIISAAVWAEKSFDALSRWICLLLIVLGLGSAHHLNNLVYTFNQQWTSGLLLSLLAIKGVMGCCSATDKHKSFAYLVMALLCTTLLAMTTFSLLAIIAAWMFLCYLLAIRWPVTVGVSLCLLLAFFISVLNLPLLDAVASGMVVDNWALFFLQALFYLGFASLRYLGSPVTEYSQLAGITLAAAALLLFINTAIKLKHQHSTRPLLVLALAYAVFVLGMALSTAVGRLEPHHAINPRFRTFILPFLVFAGIVFVYQIQSYKPTLRLVLSFALLTLSLLVIVPGHIRQLLKFSDEYDLYLPGSIALASGFSDVSVVHESRFANFQVVDNVQMLKYHDLMKNNQRGIFATDFYQQINSTILLPTQPAALDSGELTAIRGGGYLWRGTTQWCDSEGRVAVVDAQGLIIGAGMVNRKLQDSGWRLIYEVFLPYCRVGHPVPWRAYIPPLASGTDAAVKNKPFYAAVFDQQTPRLIAHVQLP